LYNGLFYVSHVVRHFQHDREAHTREDRDAPQQVELAGRRLFDFEIGRPRLVGRGLGGERTEQDKQEATERTGK
jgi:hypothetical protein